MTIRKPLLMAGALIASAVLLAGCASSAPADESSGDPVTIDFWGWAAGYDKSVDLWNETHPDVQVNYEAVAAGSYDKMLTASKAGNAPCLTQIGYETFTSFLAAGALEDVSDYVTDASDEFPEWVWNNVGIDGKAYGVPVDTGPMATFYRADLFEAAGIPVPTTWDEFATAAEAIKAYDPNARIMNLTNNSYLYSGFAWQAGAPWFGIDDDSWTVSIDSDANKKVGDYWQALRDKDLVASLPAFDAALFSAWADGTVWTEVGPVWSAALIRDNSAASAGKWAVAPMPKWDGSDAVGNSGGSSTAVMKGCEHPKEATEFALWMSTDADSVANLIDSAAIFPASVSGQESPALDAPDAYFGGQAIYQVFKEESPKVNPDWQWGPVMSTTIAALDDGLGKVQAGSGTISEALDASQAATVDQITSQGYSLSK